MVADALTANGFAAHAEKYGDELQIVAENCPFGGAAIEHPSSAPSTAAWSRACSTRSTGRAGRRRRARALQATTSA